MWQAIVPAAISAVASIFGGVRANQSNQSIANAQMAFQANSQAASMEFNRAEREASQAYGREMWDRQVQNEWLGLQATQAFANELRSTGYQVAMADMRKAGLNPILAYGQGPAATPPGGSVGGSPLGAAAASVSPMPGASTRVSDVISPAVANAIQASRVVSELEQLSENIRRTGAETRLLQAQEQGVQAQTEQTRAATATEVQRAISEGQRPDLIRAETEAQRARAAEAYASAARIAQETEFSRNWGPQGPIRDLAVSGEQVFTRALAAVRAGASSVEDVARAVWGEGVSIASGSRLMIQNLLNLMRELR